MLLAAMLLTCCSEDSDITAQNAQHARNAGKTLVVYYSYTNNCHEIVQTLTSQIEADVMRIEPADKTQKYEANNYAIGTQLLNAIASPTSHPIRTSSSSRPYGGVRWQPFYRPTSFIMVRKWQAKTLD